MPRTGPINLPPVVPASWLAEHLGEAVVADVRWYLDGRSGRAAFEAGHVEGAVFVDLDTDLSGPAGGTAGRHPLPSPEAFAAALGRLGIAAGDTLVAYDDSGGGTAGRLVWMLRVLGRDAALLDGGLDAWSGPRATGPGRPRPPVTVPAVPWPADRFVDADEVARWAGSPDRVVLDARAPERYRGDLEPIDARPGHVPGARSAPWTGILDPATGHLLAADRLRAHFAALGVTAGSGTVVYCGSGVSACADLLALEVAGLPGARLFTASWSGWAADPARPAATGDTP